MNRFAILAIAFMAGCPGNQNVLPGNLGRVTDAVQMPCTPFGEAHTCVVMANPWTKQLRVFDATAGQFVLAPNGYFPLALKVGEFTSRLVSHAQSRFVYAVDGVSQKLFMARASADQGNAFLSPTALSLASSSEAAILAHESGSRFWMIAIDSQQVTAFKIDDSNQTRPAPKDEITFPVGTALSDIAMDPQEEWFVVSDWAEKTLRVFNVHDFVTNKNTMRPVNLAGVAARVWVERVSLGGNAPEPVALVLLADSYKVQLVRLVDTTQIYTAELDSLPVAAYISDPNAAPCCNGKKSWAAVITASGKLHYLLLNNLPNQTADAPAIGATVELGTIKKFASLAGLGAAIVGGPVILNEGDTSCPRKMFLAFGSGLAASLCEGSTDIKRLDRPE